MSGHRPDIPSDEELLAFCDEALPADEMARIERLVRESPTLQQRLATLCQQRDQGVKTIGAIWRANRLSCPDRDELGAYLLGALDREAADYVRFHIELVGCRYCHAELKDLERAEAEVDEGKRRRRRFVESSLRYLPSRHKP